MQEILNQFGVQPILLLAQIVNFLIVLLLLKKFALKPILQVLKERQTTIAESIKNAEAAQKALDSATEKEKEILQKAASEAKNTLSDAKNQATEIAKESEEKTREQVERMIQDAHKKIEKQTEDAEKQLATKVAVLASDMLKTSLKGLIDEKDQTQVIEKAEKNLKKN
jgi:F-type H+-transporting ATPase subunit b